MAVKKCDEVAATTTTEEAANGGNGGAEVIGSYAEGIVTAPTGLYKHLYAVDEGCPIGDDFFDSEWEREIVEKELEKDSLVAWYRNRRGGNNAISVPYSESGEMKSMHPDLVFVHEVDGKYVVDLVDPHGPHLSDTSPKWVGLAAYAAKHSDSYRSLKAVIKEGDKLRVLELKGKGIEDAIKKATLESEIRKLFKSKGVDY